MKDPKLLLSLCEQGVVRPDFQPKDGITHCNQFADFVATAMGCEDLHDHAHAPIMADSIYEMFISSSNWRCVTLGGVSFLANQGSLVFGIMTSKMLSEAEAITVEHGHICVAIPGVPVYSSHWEAQAPLCANVGIANFCGRPMSFAFRSEPDFFCWIPSL